MPMMGLSSDFLHNLHIPSALLPDAQIDEMRTVKTLAMHDLSTSINPDLADKPPRPQSIRDQEEKVPEPEVKKSKQPWQANVARPGYYPRKNQSELAIAAHAAREMTPGVSSTPSRVQAATFSSNPAQERSETAAQSQTQGQTPTTPQTPTMQNTARTPRSQRSGKQNVASTMSLSNFPVPGQSIESKSHRNASGEWNVENGPGLGIQPSRSLANLPGYSDRHDQPRSKSPSRSIASTNSIAKSQSCNSLGDTIGFTFKTTTNFVHPNRQFPRAMTPMSRELSASRRRSGRSSASFDEDPTEMAERMNSITSDGGWKSGWSVSGLLATPSAELEEDPLTAVMRDISQVSGEVAPDDDHEPTIVEQDEDNNDITPSMDWPQPLRLGATAESLSPVKIIATTITQESPIISTSPSRNLISSTPTDSAFASHFGKALKSRASSISLRLRNRDDADSNSESAPSSPLKGQFRLERALSVISRKDKDELEDPITRRASITAARRAFEEKEAAKDRKFAEQEAKKVVGRRESSAHERVWRRKLSNAVDSAIDSSGDKPNGGLSLGMSFVMNNGNVSQPITPANEYHVDPFVTTQTRETVQDTTDFPTYKESLHPNANDLLFNPKYREEAFTQSTLFPPIRTPTEEASGMLFPAPPAAGPTVYNIDGKLFDEYGMPINTHALDDHLQHDKADVNLDDNNSRQLSVAKQAKGKLHKFSAWSKTRLLRV